MGILNRFKKNKEQNSDTQINEDLHAQESSTLHQENYSEETATVNHGPYDYNEAREKSKCLNMGAIKVPAIADMQIIPDPSPQEGYYTSVTLLIDDSALNLMVLSDSKTSSIWNELLELLSQDTHENNGTFTEQKGSFGKEYIVKTPVTTPDGRKATETMCLIGFEGPRWVLRTIITGKALNDEQARNTVDEILNKIVVDRGENPIPPGEILLLTLPDNLADMLQEKE